MQQRASWRIVVNVASVSGQRQQSTMVSGYCMQGEAPHCILSCLLGGALPAGPRHDSNWETQSTGTQHRLHGKENVLSVKTKGAPACCYLSVQLWISKREICTVQEDQPAVWHRLPENRTRSVRGNISMCATCGSKGVPFIASHRVHYLLLHTHERHLAAGCCKVRSYARRSGRGAFRKADLRIDVTAPLAQCLAWLAFWILLGEKKVLS